jgi:hypothetical protein
LVKVFLSSFSLPKNLEVPLSPSYTHSKYFPNNFHLLFLSSLSRRKRRNVLFVFTTSFAIVFLLIGYLESAHYTVNSRTTVDSL